MTVTIPCTLLICQFLCRVIAWIPLRIYSINWTLVCLGAKPSIISSWSLPRPPTMISHPRLLPTNLCPILHPRRLRPLIKQQLCLLHPHIRPTLPFLDAMSSTPAFGQASSFSSPFARELGRALSGTTGGGPTVGAKSSIRAFAWTKSAERVWSGSGFGRTECVYAGRRTGRWFYG